MKQTLVIKYIYLLIIGSLIFFLSGCNRSNGHNNTESGINWSEVDVPISVAKEGSWKSISCSPDGTKIAAANNGGYIYLSSDTGKTWKKIKTLGRAGGSDEDHEGISWEGAYWKKILFSGDSGSLIVIKEESSESTGNDGSFIYISEDNGKEWYKVISGGRNDDGSGWDDVICSSDGVKIAALDGQVYTSSDGGVTWTERAVSGTALAGSSGGDKMIVAAKGGYIYTSSNSGIDWTMQTLSGERDWKTVTCSSDGTIIAAAVSGGYIYTSSDGGVNWTEQTLSGERDWTGLTISDDGSLIIAASDTGIYKSSDGGASWTLSKSGIFNGIDASNNGEKIAAAQKSGYIQISENSGTDWSKKESVGERKWIDALISVNGASLIIRDGKRIYKSSDGGSTFTELEFPEECNSYTSMAGSADLNKLVFFGGRDVYCYISGNGGETWNRKKIIRNLAADKNIRLSAIQVSEDGEKVMVSYDIEWDDEDGDEEYFQYIAYISSDGGETWNNFFSSDVSYGEELNYSLFMSGDGNKMIRFFLDYSNRKNYIHSSTDDGATWTFISAASCSEDLYKNCVSSSDLSFFAGFESKRIYTSEDSGISFTKRKDAGKKSWKSITCSSNGLMLAAAGREWDGTEDHSYVTNRISVSLNGGQDWVEEKSAGEYEWAKVCYSADGATLVALAEDSNSLFIGRTDSDD